METVQVCGNIGDLLFTPNQHAAREVNICVINWQTFLDPFCPSSVIAQCDGEGSSSLD